MTTLPVDDISQLNKFENLASEQKKDHRLATFKIIVPGRDHPEDVSNSRLPEELAKRTEMDASRRLVQLTEEKKRLCGFRTISAD